MNVSGILLVAPIFTEFPIGCRLRIPAWKLQQRRATVSTAERQLFVKRSRTSWLDQNLVPWDSASLTDRCDDASQDHGGPSKMDWRRRYVSPPFMPVPVCAFADRGRKNADNSANPPGFDSDMSERVQLLSDRVLWYDIGTGRPSLELWTGFTFLVCYSRTRRGQRWCWE